jgi:hypothetical protein
MKKRKREEGKAPYLPETLDFLRSRAIMQHHMNEIMHRFLTLSESHS